MCVCVCMLALFTPSAAILYVYYCVLVYYIIIWCFIYMVALNVFLFSCSLQNVIDSVSSSLCICVCICYTVDTTFTSSLPSFWYLYMDK